MNDPPKREPGQERRADAGRFSGGEATSKHALSSQQRSLWFLHQLDPSDCSYNENQVLRLKGKLVHAELERALGVLVQRHHILSTVYSSEQGTPVQIVLPNPELRLPLIPIEGVRSSHSVDAAMACIRTRALEPFDLAGGLPIRADLYRLGADDHMFHLSVHHIAIDGWSWPILIDDLFSAYAHVTDRDKAPPQPPAIQYADYATRQKRIETDEALTPALDFWRKRMTGAADLNLPHRKTEPAAGLHRGGVINFAIPSDLGKKCIRLARTLRTTPFIVLLSVYQILLARLSGNTDIVVGVPVSNRRDEVLEQAVGLFVNTVAARSVLSESDSFSSLVETVRKGWLDSLEYQDLPFDKLVTALHPERDTGRHPVFQVFFSYLRAPRLQSVLPGLDIARVETNFDDPRFEIELSVQDTGDGIEAKLIYDRHLFEAPVMERMASQYLMLLEAATRDADVSIWHVPMLTPDERRVMLEEWNDTARPYPECALHDLFEYQVEKTPTRVAIRHDRRELTYAELNERANRIAARLVQMGVKPETPVAVHIERSADYIVASLAVWKAGGAVVPLDTALPVARRELILGDCGAKILVTSAQVLDLHLSAGQQRLDLIADARLLERAPACNPPGSAGPDNAAYILYTSGSTGQPNGVLGLHRGLVNRLDWMQCAFPFAVNDVCAAKSPVGFVDSLTEIFNPLVFGACLVVLDDSVVSDTRVFVAALERSLITRVVLVPSLLRVLLETAGAIDQRLARLKLWITSGEALSADLIRAFRRQLPGRQLVNLYGSTEVTGDATAWIAGDGSTSAIGQPIANMECYILDDRAQPVPLGIPGQLHVGGAGLAREYPGRQKLTNERFVYASFHRDRSIRLFRTGDRARFLADGTIEFLGRDNSQVNLRGHRVEIGEVEAALQAIDTVLDAVVLPVPDALTANHLVGFVRSRKPGADSSWARSLRGELQRTLPRALVPARIVAVKEFPLTESGKIDKRACLAIDSPNAPETPDRDMSLHSQVLEDRLLEIWRNVLEDSMVGRNSDFFELGGHSLLAVKLVAQIEQTIGIALPVTALFDTPTVRQLTARLLDRPDRFAAFLMEATDLAADRPPLFCLRGLFYYRELAKVLKETAPVYAVLLDGEGPSEGKIARRPGNHLLRRLAERYVSQIRRVCPTGPYYLAGLSAGGIVALEVARQLKASGQEIGLVALLDTNGPRSPLRMRMGHAPRSLLRRLLRRSGPGRAGSQDIRDLYDDAHRLFRKHRYEGNVVIFRATFSDFGYRARDLGWHRFVEGDIIVHDVPGDHLGMMREPHVSVLGSLIAPYLGA